MICITHHHACDCREQKIAHLAEAAASAAAMLDAARLIMTDRDARDEAGAAVKRLYDAVEGLGFVV